MVGLSRVGSPAVSRDGRRLVWDQRKTDLAANRGRHDLRRLDLRAKRAQAEPFASLPDAEESDPAFGPDGQLYFLSDRDGHTRRVWRVAITGRTPIQVTGDYDLAGLRPIVRSPLGQLGG